MVQFQHQIPEKQSHRKNIINSNSSLSLSIKHQRREYILDIQDVLVLWIQVHPKYIYILYMYIQRFKDLLRTFSSPH